MRLKLSVFASFVDKGLVRVPLIGHGDKTFRLCSFEACIF